MSSRAMYKVFMHFLLIYFNIYLLPMEIGDPFEITALFWYF